MLDDRNVVPDPFLTPTATWTYDNNITAWNAVLGDSTRASHVSPIAAPARLTNFAGLPPAYVETGELDIFRDEDITYAQQLAAAGIPVELHVHPGAPHGFDRFAPTSTLARRAFADRARSCNRYSRHQQDACQRHPPAVPEAASVNRPDRPGSPMPSCQITPARKRRLLACASTGSLRHARRGPGTLAEAAQISAWSHAATRILRSASTQNQRICTGSTIRLSQF
jgi:alpha/beta hydrolase fold